jgi:hypothetical protein
MYESFAAPLECGPVIADVDGDDQLDLLVAEQDGRLHCYDTGVSGAVYWGVPGGDRFNRREAESAYSFGQVPHGFQWAWK